MKQGFMLIELIIATLIASLIAGLLFAMLFQITLVQTSVDNVIDLSVRVGVVENQLEKDLTGCFVPKQAEESSSAKAMADTSKDVKKVEPEGDKKETAKLIQKIFYSTNKNGQLDTLTFITNNPLVVYAGKDVGVAKPKAVRVQYTLTPEEHKKDSYALLRQESMELDLEKYKNVTPYEVIGGIKKCTVTFTARIPKQQDNKQQASEQNSSKVLYEYKTLNEWVSEQKKEDKESKDKSEFPRIPYSVEMKLTLWDLQEKKEKEFTVVCEIPTDFSPVKVKKQDKKEADKPKQEDKSAEQSADQVPFAPKVAANTREIIRVVDQTGKIVYQGDKNENTMNEIQKRFGMRV
jgi:type II secretory pathway component PulJ